MGDVFVLLRRFKELLKEYEETLDAKSVLEKINDDYELKQTFINEFIEIIRDELTNNSLLDYIDCADWFGYEMHIRALLKTIILHLEKVIEYKYGGNKYVE